MARILQISQLGHPVLRERAAAIEDISSSQTQDLIDDLMTTLADANAAGIAAPQVYVAQRLFIVSAKPSPLFPDRPAFEPTAVVNPDITWQSGETVKDWEGCLSVPGVRCLVPRAQSIRVAYTTREGERVEAEYSDYLARVFQHEYDHLDGVIFFDRLASTRDIVMEKEFVRTLNHR